MITVRIAGYLRHTLGIAHDPAAVSPEFAKECLAMREPDPPPAGSPTDYVVVAALLLDASPDRAESFALAMHELACERGDEATICRWSAVHYAIKVVREKSCADPSLQYSPPDLIY